MDVVCVTLFLDEVVPVGVLVEGEDVDSGNVEHDLVVWVLVWCLWGLSFFVGDGEMLLDGRLEVGVALLLYGDGWGIRGLKDGVVCCPCVL